MANEILKKKLEKAYEAYYGGYYASLNSVEPTVAERKDNLPISFDDWGTKRTPIQREVRLELVK